MEMEVWIEGAHISYYLNSFVINFPRERVLHFQLGTADSWELKLWVRKYQDPNGVGEMFTRN